MWFTHMPQNSKIYQEYFMAASEKMCLSFLVLPNTQEIKLAAVILLSQICS